MRILLPTKQFLVLSFLSVCGCLLPLIGKCFLSYDLKLAVIFFKFNINAYIYIFDFTFNSNSYEIYCLCNFIDIISHYILQPDVLTIHRQQNDITFR